ncbi:MAG TPA: beta-N-acetylhexosaminidase [Gammaproteobacteria bacterium]|nr:beta-N-acetylhexosaminidase [Gammaproteobacteria bacterium]
MGQKLGALIIDLQGLTLTEDERALLNHPMVGGVILFKRNYESRAQLITLCQRIRLANPRPLLIMVDQEGGRVQRFIPEFTQLPPLASLGDIYDKNPEAGLMAANQHATTMAQELLSAGVTISLAPVLDLNKGISGVIGDRAFHRNPETVITLAKAYMQAMHAAGMPAIGKHFPGHGSVTLDSHLASPIDPRSFAELMTDDLQPFVSLMQAGMPGVMASHVIFPEIDDKPVGFSRTWLKTIIRDQLHYTGVILTDDLNMQGASVVGDCTARIAESREAGCDFALLCNNREGVIHALDHLPYAAHQVDESVWRALQPETLTC